MWAILFLKIRRLIFLFYMTLTFKGIEGVPPLKKLISTSNNFKEMIGKDKSSFWSPNQFGEIDGCLLQMVVIILLKELAFRLSISWHGMWT